MTTINHQSHPSLTPLKKHISRQLKRNRFREHRHVKFLGILASMPRPVTILDVGGSRAYWHRLGTPNDVTITLLNLRAEQPIPGISTVSGDACDLSRYSDKSFDCVFSNSVIEHVGDFARQQAMANEIRRVGRSYFVQTPARSFPIEPHYRLPCIQYLSTRWQRLTAQVGIALRYYPPRFVNTSQSIRLLSKDEIKHLFPDAILWEEMFGPLTKSYVAYRLPG